MTEQVSNIQIYQDTDGKAALQIKLDQETVWLTQEQMSMLFGRERSVIAKHICNIFKESELDENSVRAFFAQTAPDCHMNYRVILGSS